MKTAGDHQSAVDNYNALRTGYSIPLTYGLSSAGLGALAGGLYGAASGQKGKRRQAIMRGVLGGAFTGGAGGLGLGLGMRSAMPAATHMSNLERLRVLFGGRETLLTRFIAARLV